MKTKLSIEESARLIELGVDAKLASMVSWKLAKNWQRKSVIGDKEHLQLKPFQPLVMGFEKFDCKDIFTLTDILSILPKDIGNYGLEISSAKDGYFASYVLWDNTEDYDYIRDSLQDKPFSSPELIDALYQLLIWAIEHDYINSNKGK